MEHKIDEAAVWQRVTGSDAGRQVLLTPELLNILAQMESCLRLLNQLARSNRRSIFWTAVHLLSST